MVSATPMPKVWKLHALNTEAYQQTLHDLRTEADMHASDELLLVAAHGP